MEAMFSPTQNHDIVQWDLSSTRPSLFTWLQLEAVKDGIYFVLLDLVEAVKS